MSMKEYKYAVVAFPEEDGVEAVPVKWLTNKDTQCYWPSFKNVQKTTLAIKTQLEPNSKEFKKYPVRVLKKYVDYKAARLHLEKATYQSDLQETEEEDNGVTQKRVKRPNPKFLDNQSESDEESDPSEFELPQQLRKKARSLPLGIPPLPAVPVVPALSETRRMPIADDDQSNTLFAASSNSVYRSPTSSPSLAYERKILVGVEELKAQVHLNTKLLQAISRKLDCLANEDHVEELDTSGPQIAFPLTTKEAILQAEDLLQTEESRKKLVRSLSTIGGATVKLSVRRLLAHMITNQLAQKINWLGKGGKIAFSTLNLNSVLKDTIRKNRLCNSATNDEISSVAKDWFRFAGDRDGGRKKREERKKARLNAQEQNENSDNNN